jgi:hypothetical protein
MGDAGTAAAEGPQAMYWNPAISAYATHFGLNASYSAWFQSMSKGGIFAVRPTPYFTIGAGVTAFSAGELEYRDDHPSDSALGTYSPGDYSLYVGLSRVLAPKIAMGITGRYYYQRLAGYGAGGYGGDVGLLYEPLAHLKVGASVLDFGSGMKFNIVEYTLPTRANLGVSYGLPIGRSEINVAADGGFGFFDRTYYLNTGAEFVLNQVLALRLGYKALDQNRGLTAGLGLKVKGIRIEYSFGLHEQDLGTTSRFAIGYGY